MGYGTAQKNPDNAEPTGIARPSDPFPSNGEKQASRQGKAPDPSGVSLMDFGHPIQSQREGSPENSRKNSGGH